MIGRCRRREHVIANDDLDRVVGRIFSDDTFHKLEYDERGRIVLLETEAVRTRYTYDARGRCIREDTEFVDDPSSATAIAYLYDLGLLRIGTSALSLSPRGDVRSIHGRVQSHLKGGRLVRADGVSLTYDSRGRLVKKVDRTEETTYEWSVLGLLAGVKLPDSTRLEFVYDGFARRLEKRVLRQNEVVRHRYRWDADDLLEETVERRTTNTDAETPFTLVERRRYACAPGVPMPIAQAVDTEVGPGAWRYFVHRDGAPVPVALVRADGAVDEVFETEAYGRAIAGDVGTTRTRFPGHWYDQETRLHYNRWATQRHLRNNVFNEARGRHCHASAPRRAIPEGKRVWRVATRLAKRGWPPRNAQGAPCLGCAFRCGACRG